MDSTFRVKDKLEFWFCRVDMAVFMDEALSIYDSHVYAALCSFAAQSGECFPSVKTLSKRAKCSERQTRMSLRVLEEQGYITTTAQSGGVNVYTLVREKHLEMAPAHHAEGAAYDAGEGGTPCRQTRTNELDIKNTPAGEPPAPAAPKNETQPQADAKPCPAEAGLISPDDVPAAMKECVDYFTLKTGRAGIRPDELSAVRELEKIHTPQRVNREISKAVERYSQKNRPLSELTLTYIYESLKFQTSRKTGRNNAAPVPKKEDPYEGCLL